MHSPLVIKKIQVHVYLCTEPFINFSINKYNNNYQENMHYYCCHKDDYGVFGKWIRSFSV